MTRIVKYLLVGVLVVGGSAACNHKAGSGGSGTSPGTNQNGGGGGY